MDEITRFEYDHPGCFVSRYVTDGPWYVASLGNFWRIVNVRTGKTKKVGRIGAKRVNYFHSAVEEAVRRNAVG